MGCRGGDDPGREGRRKRFQLLCRFSTFVRFLGSLIGGAFGFCGSILPEMKGGDRFKGGRLSL